MGGAAVGAHAASLFAGFLVLLYCNRGQWFWGDEWAFLGHRGVLHADRSLWAPHSEHWLTGPILIYRSLYAVFGVRTYVPYVVVLLLLHLAVSHLLWQLMRRAGIDPALATGLAATYVLLGAGYENLLWAFQIGFVGSVALGLAAVLLVNHDGPFDRRDVTGWVVGVASLMFSGIGVTMVAVVTVTVLLRRGLRDAALTVAVPCLVYVVWLALAGREGLDAHPRTLDSVLTYPDYIWTGMRAAVEEATGFPGAGTVLVLGLAAWLLRRAGTAAGPAAPAFAGAIGGVLLFSVIAVGRTALGAQQAQASRYTYVVMAMALPAMGLVLHELVDHLPSRRAFVLFLLFLVALHNLGVLREQTRRQTEAEKGLRTFVVAAARLVSSPGEVILNDRPEPLFNPDIVVEDLRRMQREDKLPKVDVTPADRVAAATVLQYATGTAELGTPSTPPRVERVTGAVEQRTGPGCVRLTPATGGAQVEVAAGRPMSLIVTSSAGGEVSGYLRIRTPITHTGPPRIDKLQPGVPLYVTVTASVDALILRIPATGFTDLCGVQ